jgi:S-adenosylmethionine:tRNA ribosyltransferase-isomerase
MKTSDFNFKLPLKLLVDRPTQERDESRLMIVNRKKNKIEHKVFKDILNVFHKNDVIILNDTKVFPAKLYGNKEKTNADIEVLLLRDLNPIERIWEILVNPARKIRIGNKINFKIPSNNEILTMEIIDNTTSRGRIGHFLCNISDQELKKKIKTIGLPPLPKYIARPIEKSDFERYQTIYAKKEGSVVAPTAGLHFSKILLKKLELKDVLIVNLTLHIGLCTSSKIFVEDISKHKLHSEQCIIEQETCDKINNAINNNKRICAVGTSSMRALESAVAVTKHLLPLNRWTSKFIFPPYKFKIANCMITNFHFPKTPELMMVSAFTGYDLIMKAYEIAIQEKYRFNSYGDAMLIL